jgi:hypothetical protein
MEDSATLISAEERTRVVDWLKESHTEFVACIEGLSGAQWKWRPAPGRWSIGETAEHTVLAEVLLFDVVHKALAAPPNPGWEEHTKGKTEFIVRVMPTRVGNAQAPESIVPRFGLAPAQVKERFERRRVDICKFAAETRLPLKAHTADHPFPIFGALNAYQWLIYIPLHSMRHVKQIAEIKATAGYRSHARRNENK